jgi:hypothetical protein
VRSSFRVVFDLTWRSICQRRGRMSTASVPSRKSKSIIDTSNLLSLSIITKKNAQREVDVRDYGFRILGIHVILRQLGLVNRQSHLLRNSPRSADELFINASPFKAGYSSSYLPFLIRHKVLSSCRASCSSYVLIRRSSRKCRYLYLKAGIKQSKPLGCLENCPWNSRHGQKEAEPDLAIGTRSRSHASAGRWRAQRCSTYSSSPRRLNRRQQHFRSIYSFQQ